MKKGKHYTDSLKLYDRSKAYEAAEAIDLAVQTAKAKFDETIEISVKLGVDPRHADQQVRGVVVLPNGTGKTVRVLVIAKGAKADEAKAAGADIVGAEEIIQKIQGGWFDFDTCVTTPDMMGQVGRLGKLLGPKGLMPTPKSGTVRIQSRQDGNYSLPDRKEIFRSGKAERKPCSVDGRYYQSASGSRKGHLSEEHRYLFHDGPRHQSQLQTGVIRNNCPKTFDKLAL